MFRFTIRDLLWLMVVVGLAVGWWLDHRAVGALRAHAWLLRDALEQARWHHAPLHGNTPATTLAAEVDWSLADDPIP